VLWQLIFTPQFCTRTRPSIRFVHASQASLSASFRASAARSAAMRTDAAVEPVAGFRAHGRENAPGEHSAFPRAHWGQ
jgi:hypothetical protein